MSHFIYPLHSRAMANTSYDTLLQQVNPLNADTEIMQLDSPYSIVYMNCTPDDPETYLRILLLCPGTHHTYLLNQDSPHISYFLNRSLHQHDFFEIMYVIRGVVRQHIEKSCFPYSAGQCCFINKGTKHIEEYTTQFEAVFFGMAGTFLMDMIRGDILYAKDAVARKYNCDIYQSICDSAKETLLDVKKYIDYVPVSEEAAKEINGVMDAIILESINQRPGSSFITLGLCARFISTLEEEEKFHKNLIRLDCLTKDFLFLRVRLILERNNGRIKREQLEGELNYSADYLNRIVKSSTGMSLVDYGLTICLKEAGRLLLQTEFTVGEIITRLGFSNRSYFYRIFERQYGLSPQAFRASRQKDDKTGKPTG